MKNRRVLPLLAFTGLSAILTLGPTASPALAQPNGGTATTGKGKAKGARGSKGAISKKMVAKIEEKMGKPLTADQKSRLDAANKTRLDAQKAAQASFDGEVATITGLTAAQVAELGPRGGKGGGKGRGDAGKMAPAPR